MPLTIPSRLGPYEILSLLGAGGMGEVYRARDPRLGRDVAIKVLPSAFSSNGERLHRFEQEARAAAALNHPNILAVYDIGSHNGAPYIVSELLEGETLSERLDGGHSSMLAGTPHPSQRQGPTPGALGSRLSLGRLPRSETRAPGGPQALAVRKVVDYAVQIAHGLAAAHEKGIVHRDLKPANIFITADGRVKILDFGLAKLTEREPVLSGASTLPTAAPDTLPGMVLGTVGYMSPEQVRGHTADHRADIFAFGAILYEMLSGHRAFAGDTVADTMTAILKEDPPDLPTTERHIPPALARIVDRCLEKSPAARFQSAGDLGFALETLSLHSGATEAVIGAVRPAKKRERLAWSIAALAIVVAVGGGTAVMWPRATPDAQVIRLSVQPEGNNSIFGYSLAVSPDGRHVAFVGAGQAGTPNLWVRSLDELSAKPVPGTAGANQPFWSPDSRSIGFFAGGSLKRVDLAGGTAQTLAVGNPYGATWGNDGTILFVPAPNGGLVRVQASGAGPTVSVRQATAPSTRIQWPWFLPDGIHYLYSVAAPAANTGIYVGSLDSSDTHRLADGTSNAAFAAGYLVFMRSTTLVAQSLDLKSFRLTGEPMAVAEGVRSNGVNGQFQFAVSSSGVISFRTGSTGASQLAWLDRSGHQIATVGPVGDYLNPELSPDGKRVAFERGGPQGNRDVWLLDLAREVFTRFTLDPATDQAPIWSPDGTRIVFGSDRTGRFELYQKLANGAGKEETLFQSNIEKDKLVNDWSHDGRFVVFRTLESGGYVNMWLLPMSGERKAFPFSPSPFNQANGRVSPDGRWIAYNSSESGTYQIYIQSFPSPAGGKWQVSAGGGVYPRWSRDGKELFYLAADGQLMAVPVRVTGAGSNLAPELGTPKQLFDARLLGGSSTTLGFRHQYDVAPDGQRFLVNLETGSSDSPITVVVNWTAGLKK